MDINFNVLLNSSPLFSVYLLNLSTESHNTKIKILAHENLSKVFLSGFSLLHIFFCF